MRQLRYSLGEKNLAPGNCFKKAALVLQFPLRFNFFPVEWDNFFYLLSSYADAAGLDAFDYDLCKRLEKFFYFLARCGDELKFNGRFGLWRKEKKCAVGVQVIVCFVKDELIDDKTLGKSLFGLIVFIDNAHYGLFISDRCPRNILDILFLWNVAYYIGAVFIKNEQLVEVSALHFDRS